MKNVIYVTGHKNPDTDSICASIAYAEFKNKTQNLKAIPIRLGNLNKETKFILDYFDVPVPIFMDTIKPQVSDLDIDKTATISEDITLLKAWNIMQKNDAKTLPVVNGDNNIVGILSMSNLTSTYMDIWNTNIVSESYPPLENIAETLSGKVVMTKKEHPYFSGKITVCDNLEDGTTYIDEGDIVICTFEILKDYDVRKSDSNFFVLTNCNYEKYKDEILKIFDNLDKTVICTAYDTFTVSKLITLSIPVSYIMTKDNFVVFSLNNYLDDVKDIMLKSRFRSYPVINRDSKVVGSISRYHLISAKKKKLILLDHNERTQSIHGIEDAEVLEIIDHHRIGDIQTGNPVYFRNEPVGSTSTIVAQIFFENGIMPSRKTASILCSAIISDTLNFKSPTSTNIDRLVLERLSHIANIDLNNFAKELFKAGTSIEGRTANEVFHQDFKVFTIQDLKVGVSQLGTMSFENFDPLRADMIKLMIRKCRENGFNILIFMLTDINAESSKLFVVGDAIEIVERAFNVQIEGNEILLPGVISRKKQVIPPITTAITTNY